MTHTNNIDTQHTKDFRTLREVRDLLNDTAHVSPYLIDHVSATMDKEDNMYVMKYNIQTCKILDINYNRHNTPYVELTLDSYRGDATVKVTEKSRLSPIFLLSRQPEKSEIIYNFNAIAEKYTDAVKNYDLIVSSKAAKRRYNANVGILLVKLFNSKGLRTDLDINTFKIYDEYKPSYCEAKHKIIWHIKS